jgi:hypothetical protein
MVAPGATGNKAHTSNTLGTGGWTAYLIGLKPSSGAVGGDNTVTFDAGASAGFPDATNTGVPVGTSLAASGNITTTSNGQIIDARNISGIVRIRHNNVTLKRCRITSDDGIIVECDAGLPTGLIVEDCTIVGVGGAGQTAFNPDGGGGGSIIRRCNISNVENAIGIGENAQQIRDNYIHDLFQSESAHTDGIQGTGGFTSLTIDHNSIFGVDTSCIILQNEGGGFSGAIINNNQLVMTNGSAAIYCRSDKGPGAVDNITITNNKLGKASGGGYNSIVGVTNLTYTGNTDWQTAVPVASTD